MKKLGMLICGVLLLSIVACTTEVRDPNLKKERYPWKVLITVDNKLDTAYFDNHMAEFYLSLLSPGSSIEVTETKIGYIYTTEALVNMKVSKFLGREYEWELIRLPEPEVTVIKICSQIPGYPVKPYDLPIPQSIEDPMLVPR